MNRRVWVILAAGMAVMLLSTGFRSSMGLYVQPLGQALGASVGMVTLAIAVQNLVWGFMQPVTGMLADRFGVGRVVLMGGLAFAAGLALMATADSRLELFLGTGLLMGFAIACSSFGIVMSAVARAVHPSKRGAALGFTAACGSLGQFLVSPMAQVLTDQVGWSGSLFVFAALSLVLVPVAFVLGGPAPGSSAQAAEPPLPLRAALREAATHPGFVLLVLGFTICGFQLIFVMVHLPTFIASCGLPAAVGAKAIALVGLFNMVGAYLAGVLGARFRKKYLLTGVFLVRTVAMSLYLTLPVTELSTLMFASAMGLVWFGTAPLTSGIVAEIFGLRYVATLYGFVFLGHQVGAFFGAFLGGFIFDATGGYGWMWALVFAVGVVAALIHLPMSDRPVARISGAAAG